MKHFTEILILNIQINILLGLILKIRKKDNY